MVKKTHEHLPGYQARDYEVVDYQLYQLADTDLQFRGPEPQLSPGKYFSCLGAAQTLGCFTESPYPTLLENKLNTTALNLGYGGAGPRFFNRHPELVEIANRGSFAIVQIMSGRSEDNTRFESKGLEVLTRRSDGKQMSADAAWRSVLELRYAWKHLPVGKRIARRICQAVGAADARRLLRETRNNWLAGYRELLDSLRVPKILFWFSKRTPDFQESYHNLHQFMGIYPQLVTRSMVEDIAEHADYYVECTTDRGSPQELFSRFDGKRVEIDLGRDRTDFAGQTWKFNQYYPTPEMHQDAAVCLSKQVASLLNQ